MADNSDIALGMALADRDNGCCNNCVGYGGYGNGMWGMEWIWLIVILALVWGWGGNGFGNNGNNCGRDGGNYGSMCDAFSFQEVKDGVRGVQQGLCDGFYAVNTGMLNGFAGVNQNISTNFANLNTNLCQLGANVAAGQNATNIAIMQAQNGLQSAIDNCCCTTRYEALQNANTTNNLVQQNTTQGVMNTNAIQNAIQTGFCQTNYNAQANTRDIIEAQNANTRAILDKLTCQELAAKDAQIAAQNQKLFAAELAASQATQNQYLIDQLKTPCPVPAYPACSPYEVPGYIRNSGCGCNSGCCGCNN